MCCKRDEFSFVLFYKCVASVTLIKNESNKNLSFQWSKFAFNLYYTQKYTKYLKGQCLVYIKGHSPLVCPGYNSVSDRPPPLTQHVNGSMGQWEPTINCKKESMHQEEVVSKPLSQLGTLPPQKNRKMWEFFP